MVASAIVSATVSATESATDESATDESSTDESARRRDASGQMRVAVVCWAAAHLRLRIHTIDHSPQRRQKWACVRTAVPLVTTASGTLA